MVEITEDMIDTLESVMRECRTATWGPFRGTRAALEAVAPLIEAAVIERCAQVADKRSKKWDRCLENPCFEQDEDYLRYRLEARHVATAIRELAKGEG